MMRLTKTGEVRSESRDYLGEERRSADRKGCAREELPALGILRWNIRKGNSAILIRVGQDESNQRLRKPRQWFGLGSSEAFLFVGLGLAGFNAFARSAATRVRLVFGVVAGAAEKIQSGNVPGVAMRRLGQPEEGHQTNHCDVQQSATHFRN